MIIFILGFPSLSKTFAHQTPKPVLAERLPQTVKGPFSFLLTHGAGRSKTVGYRRPSGRQAQGERGQ